MLIRHVLKLVASTLAFGLRTRRPQIIVLVVVGLALVALVVGAKAVAPVVVYPFV